MIQNKVRAAVKETRPLIHAITNPISINQCANTALAVGARPIMAEHPAEASEITRTAQALLLNLGNITDVRIQSMLISGKTANENKIPIVLDTVGAACSSFRHKFAYQLIEKIHPAVIKGNYSEILALYDLGYRAGGVDAEISLDISDAQKAAVCLAKKYNTIILASGKTDIVTDGENLFHINNGSSQLTCITGTGCMLGMLCACYMSVYPDITAVVTATAVMGICGEKAETDNGNSSFMLNLLDNLSVLSDSDVEKRLKMEEIKIESI